MSQRLGGFEIAMRSPKLHRAVRSNLVTDGGFETDTTPNDFDYWTEDTDGGNCTITADAVTVRSGAQSCKILSNAGGAVDGHVYQDISVEEKTSYLLSFWSRTENEYATMQGRYAVYDNTNAAWVVHRRNAWSFSNTAWAETTELFTTPAGCVSIRLYLYQNIDSGALATSAVYYDDVTLYKRIIRPGGILPVFHGASDISSYTHTISAVGGFDSMTFATAGGPVAMEDWLTNGLGREVVATGPGGTIIWEGFVNQITIAIGATVITLGPLTDVINMGRMIYATIDWDTTPPIRGVTVKTPWNTNEDSQEKYYVLQGNITGGEGTPSEMDTLLNSLMETVALPPVSQSFSIGGGGGDISISVECLGFMHLMDHWFYSQTQLAGTYDASAKILDIIEADPNHIIDPSEAYIESNATAVPIYEDSDKTAFELIKGIAALGDDSYNRYVFGLYEEAAFRYRVVEKKVRYLRSIRTGDVRLPSEAIVEPWDMRPGYWIFTTNTPGGAMPVMSNFRQDPRYTFIESLTFTAPYSIQIAGGRADRFKQRVERLGLGGIT